MSRSADGKFLLCDAPDCTSRIEAPVVLTSFPKGARGATPAAERWVFVQNNGIWQHFCPKHSAPLLPSPAKIITGYLVLIAMAVALIGAGSRLMGVLRRARNPSVLTWTWVAP